MIKEFIRRSFLLSFLGNGIVSGLAGLLVLFLFGEQEKTAELLVSWVLSFILILFAYLVNYWGFSKSHKAFLSVLLGGMIVRMIIFLGVIFWIYQEKYVHMLTFLTILTIYYFLFQTVEIFLIKRQLKLSDKKIK